jgi:hypothetical protein
MRRDHANVRSLSLLLVPFGHVELQRDSAWCMPVYDSEVGSGALHRRRSQAASDRRAHAPSVFHAVLGLRSMYTPKSR